MRSVWKEVSHGIALFLPYGLGVRLACRENAECGGESFVRRCEERLDRCCGELTEHIDSVVIMG